MAVEIGDRERLAEAVRDLAEKAGRAILEYYDGNITVEEKEDRSPVTEADVVAERVILEGLADLVPGLPAIAEEALAADAPPDISGRRFWLVDPLDGTREFIRRNGEFTVNIALVEDGSPTLGAVHVPAKGLTYWASGPGRAMRQGGGPVRSLAVRAPASDGYVVVASRSHRDARTDEWMKPIPVKSFSALGSSLKFCLIAMGEADLYPRLGRTMEWDTAAGHAVLLAAGGSVRTLDGGRLTYGKPGFENPFFVACGAE